MILGALFSPKEDSKEKTNENIKIKSSYKNNNSKFEVNNSISQLNVRNYNQLKNYSTGEKESQNIQNISHEQKENNNNYIFNKRSNYQLEAKIFKKFQKELETLRNECEIIESEEYILTKYEKDYDLYNKAIEINKKINKLIKKLDKINEEYKIIKNNNLIENPLLLDDTLLIDDIISYRQSINLTKDIKTIPNKIKLLEDYKYLYGKLEEVSAKTCQIKEKNEERVEELSHRDAKYKKAKEKVINLKEIETCCDMIINKNKDYLEELSKKVGKIEEKKYIETKIKGMDGFFTSALRYIGLLTLTPLRGILPGIGARTVATRRLLKGMLASMHYEEKEKIIYSINNYEHEINSKINDIDSVEENIDYALSDITKLKNEFKDYFFKYNIAEYEKAYKKIEQIEKNIKDNKEKVNIIKENLKKNKELNKNALVKVRKLNN